MLIEIFDRWLTRRKIALLKDEIAHVQDSAARHALEEELQAEESTLEKEKRTQTPSETTK